MLVKKQPSWFKTDPNQPRKDFPEEDLRPLGNSMATLGQLQPIGAKPDGTIIWGERRYRAAVLVGLPELLAIITDKVMTDSEIRLIQLVENVHRADLSGFEKWNSAAELMCMNPSWQMQDLAAKLHLSAASVTKILSASKCVEVVQQALKDGKITLSDTYSISKAPESQQAGLLSLKLSGANREALDKATRKPRTVSTVKLSSIRLPLPGGTTVTVKGDDLGGDELLEALTQARDAAIKANKENIDVKTLARVMADKAAVKS